MEQNLPIIAKKILKMMKVAYFMLRKGISKAKLLADLNMMMKRGKIAGKAALHNLMFHHHHGGATACHLSFPDSYSNSPAFHLNKRKKYTEEKLMAAAVEMLNSAAASPMLPGFGPSPMVRQLRITDSPFPLRDVEEDSHVDEAAEEFIIKFYNDLRQQNSMACLAY